MFNMSMLCCNVVNLSVWMKHTAVLCLCILCEYMHLDIVMECMGCYGKSVVDFQVLLLSFISE